MSVSCKSKIMFDVLPCHNSTLLRSSVVRYDRKVFRTIKSVTCLTFLKFSWCASSVSFSSIGLPTRMTVKGITGQNETDDGLILTTSGYLYFATLEVDELYAFEIHP